ncbi:MAG: ribonuclease Z [Cyclobacteriaceae bacterium]|nr:ribonuclease Z [Cyclobacteriaceae bacterium]
MIFQLKILGNNSAIPAHDRNQTSQLLQLDSRYVLIDCGEGTQIQLSNQNIRIGRIKTILISHLHGDHYFGLIGLISTMHLFHRKHKLTVFAPPELEKILKLQLEASDTTLCFQLEFVPLIHEEIMEIYKEEQFTIQAFPLEHGIKCYGFLIKENPKQWRINKENMPENIRIQEILTLKKGNDILNEDGSIKYALGKYTFPPRPPRSYAYCSDTRYNEQIIPFVQHVDLLYHEATFADEMEDRAALTHHSTATQAATIAKKAGVQKLLLGHYSTRYKDPTPLLDEARKIFEETYLTHEGETICVVE